MSRFSLTEQDLGGDRLLIAVTGELDLAVAEELRAAVSRAPTSRVVVDLGGCEFIDSTGIAVLLLAARELSDESRTLEVSGARGQVLRVLEVSGLAGEEGLLREFVAERPAEAA